MRQSNFVNISSPDQHKRPGVEEDSSLDSASEVKRARVMESLQATVTSSVYAQKGLEMEDEDEEEEVNYTEEESAPTYSNSEAEEGSEDFSSDQLDKDRNSVIQMCYGKLHHMSAMDQCLRKSVLIFNTMRSLQNEAMANHSDQSPTSEDSDDGGEEEALRSDASQAHHLTSTPVQHHSRLQARDLFQLDDDGGLEYREIYQAEEQVEPSKVEDWERRGWWGAQTTAGPSEEAMEEEGDEESEDEEDSSSQATQQPPSVWLSHEAGCGWSQASSNLHFPHSPTRQPPFPAPLAGEMEMEESAQLMEGSAQLFESAQLMDGSAQLFESAQLTPLVGCPSGVKSSQFSTIRSELAKSWSILNPVSPPSSSSPSPPLAFPPPPTHSSFQELVSMFEPTVNS